MIDRRHLAVGFSLILLGGCASQHKITVASGRNKINGPPPSEKAQWEVNNAPPVGPLATKAAEYAAKLQGGGTADSPVTFAQPAPTPQPVSPPTQTEFPHHRRENTDTAPLTDAAPAAPTAPAAQPAPLAQLASAKITKPIDGPQIVPESADFAASDSNSKDPLGARLRKRVTSDPHDIASQLDLQLYGMLNDDPAPELASLTELPGEDRELIEALIDGISNFRSTVREDSNLLPPQKIRPLLEMADRLRSQADLTVSTVALCRRVDAFGKYEPISPLRFPVGQENAAIVYCEVQNFLPKQNARQMWETRLSEQVTLYTDTGILAWSDPARQVTDECRERRHDFFAYNIIKMPASTPMGRYLLKVTIEDQNANRVAEATVPLEIVAKVTARSDQ